MVTDPAHELAKLRPVLERIALALGIFVVLIFAVTLVKGPGVMIRPL